MDGYKSILHELVNDKKTPGQDATFHQVERYATDKAM